MLNVEWEREAYSIQFNILQFNIQPEKFS